MVGEEGGWGRLLLAWLVFDGGRYSMVAVVAGVAVGGKLVMGWSVGGGEGGLECEEGFLLIFFPLFIFLFFFFFKWR